MPCVKHMVVGIGVSTSDSARYAGLIESALVFTEGKGSSDSARPQPLPQLARVFAFPNSQLSTLRTSLSMLILILL